jgi:DNA polymerase-3 subunit delta'
MFEEILGNESAKKLLTRLVRSGRVPQSLLFAGRSGVGKRLFALELAKAFVCTDLREETPCGVCSACRRVADIPAPKTDDRDAHKEVLFTGHPDVGLVLPYNQTIYIDAIRSLEREANFRPFEARARLFIIDEAEKLSSVKDNAANALLKTLEEPAETTHIILISARPLLLLSTIRSRCQSVRFGPISKEKIVKHMTGRLDYPSEDAALVAGLSRGSLGKALGTDLEKFRGLRRQLLEVLTRCSRRDNFAALLRTSEELCDPKAKDDYGESLHILQSLIHDVWTLQKKKGGEVVNFDLRVELEELSASTESERLVRWLSEIEQLRENLNYNLNRKLATDALFMSMAG